MIRRTVHSGQRRPSWSRFFEVVNGATLIVGSMYIIKTAPGAASLFGSLLAAVGMTLVIVAVNE